MNTSTNETHVYAFEGIDASLDLLPLAARRALDVAGCKVSLDSWKKAKLAARRALVALGSGDRVAAARVRAHLKGAKIPFDAIAKTPDPSASEVPPELADAELTASAWSALEAIDRYALFKIARGKHPENLARALAEIAPPLSTHLDARGQARMVDVGAKETTARRAIARAHVAMKKETIARLRSGDTKKGDVLATARIAGIQAAKRTPELIPLCHHVALTRMAVDIAIDDRGVSIDAIADARDRTGVEMEAMTAASVAALTVYDMLKGIDRGMRIRVELVEKAGGKSGLWTRD
jgi:cyclic pyranopterin phosphate synthase